MIFAILIFLAGTFFVRIILAIFRKVPHKVRAIVSLGFAVGLAFWSWSVREKFSNNQIGDNEFFYLLLIPLLLAIGLGFIFVSINFEDDGDNWYEYFSIGNVSFGRDINIGITIQIGAVILIATLVFLAIISFTNYLAYILYGILHLYFFIRVFFSRIE